MRVDVHAHFMDRSYYEALASLPGVSIQRSREGMGFLLRNGSKWLPFNDAMFKPDGQLRDMDGKAIDLRILSLSTPSVYPFTGQSRIDLCRRSNDRMIAEARKHPGRFLAVATLPLMDVRASLDELDRMRSASEMVGITIGSNIEGLPLSDHTLEPIWTRLNELKVPVFEHPMIPVFAAAMDEFTLPVRVGFLLDTSLAVCRMIYAGVFERHPDFPFVVAHTGAAFLDLMERLDNGFRFYTECRQHITRLPSDFAKRFYYDSCGFYGPLLMMAREIVGVERLLFGTDYPFIDAGLAHVENLKIPTNEKDMIFGGNAARLLNLKSNPLAPVVAQEHASH